MQTVTATIITRSCDVCTFAKFECFLNSAHRQEVDSDEALQRATLAMVPNPIYSGSPIYDEIVDPSLLKFLKKNSSEPQSRDEGYIEISANPARNGLGASQLPSDGKVLNDKLATMQVNLECYTAA